MNFVPSRLTSGLVSLILLAVCLLAQPAAAQITITLDNPNPIVAPGGTVVFTGTLTNTSATDTLRVTGSQVNANLYSLPSYTPLSLTSYGSTGNYSVSNGNVVLYAPGQKYSGPLFYFSVASNAALGLYQPLGGATFSIQGSTPSGGSFYYTNASPVTITVAPVAAPEPSTGAALLIGALCLGCLTGQARRRATCE